MTTRTAKKKTPAKDGYHHGDLRTALLAAATDLVAKEGTAAVSLRQLAQNVGVTHAAPYRHFKDKDALFATLAEDGFRLLRQRMILERDKSGYDPVLRLGATGVGYVGFASEHPGHFKVMFSHLGRPTAEVPKLMDEGANAFGVLVEAISFAQSAGEVRPGKPEIHALFCWATMHGLASLAIEGVLDHMGFGVDSATVAKRFGDELMKGLRPR